MTRPLLFAVAAILVRLAPPVVAQPIALTHVNVVPMDSEYVLADQTVLVHEDRIIDIGPSSDVNIPDISLIVDGTDLYLLPGLADMHTHLSYPHDLTLLLANGITTTRMMWGSQTALAWRDEINSGKRLGPSLFTSGPILEGPPPVGYEEVIPISGKIILATPDEARTEVERQIAAGYDFIKVYNNLATDVYDAIFEIADAHGIPVVGHVPVDVGVQGALAAGQQSIEHLRGYSNALVPPDAPIQPGPDYRSRELSWQYGDVARAPDIAAATRDAGTYSTPTLMTQIYSMPQRYIDAFFARPEAVFMHPRLRSGLQHRESMRWLSFSGDDYEGSERGYPIKQALVRALRDAGAKILAGSDLTPLGFTLHHELQNLVEAGLTPYEALEAATSTAQEALGRADSLGTIAEGKLADMVLVRGNPLDDVSNASQIEGVMLRGRWMPENVLEGMIGMVRRSLPAVEALDQGIRLARKGDVDGAVEMVEQTTLRDAVPSETVAYWTSLCWYGALWNQAAKVMDACERAVELAPENGDTHDARGLARALTGDTTGAISDLSVFAQWSIRTADAANRLRWVSALERGENPFTDEVLQSLREADCTSMVPAMKLCR